MNTYTFHIIHYIKNVKFSANKMDLDIWKFALTVLNL